MAYYIRKKCLEYVGKLWALVDNKNVYYIFNYKRRYLPMELSDYNYVILQTNEQGAH